MLAFGLADGEAGAGVEQISQTPGHVEVHRLAVNVQQISHAKRFFPLNHHRFMPAQRVPHPAVFAHVPVRSITGIRLVIAIGIAQPQGLTDLCAAVFAPVILAIHLGVRPDAP